VIELAETPAELHEPTIALPELPRREKPGGFPFVMVIAPVIVALVLFAVLRSPYVLIFAVFGPVLGIASVIDQRVGARRRYRRALEDYEGELERSRAEIAAAHERIRRRARTQAPLARDIVRGARCATGLTLGVTSVVGSLRTSGNHAELARHALIVDRMPHTVTASAVVVRGGGADFASVTRAVAVSLLAPDPSARFAVVGERLSGLRAELARSGVEICDPEEAEVLLADVDAQGRAHMDRHEEIVHVKLDGDGEASVTDADGTITRIAPAQLGAPEFEEWLASVAEAQASRHRAERALPSECSLSDVLGQGKAGPGCATFLVGVSGGRAVDLVADGPHAVIGGTTGSGKSELLVSWAVALAAEHTSSELVLLCLDFKGGATFDAIAALPHCTGIVTDLDGDEAVRVAEGLRAELHRREARLRELGLREIPRDDVADGIPRLVVFIDEYQALVHAHPELQEVVADVAARGRSLGIHLVLCTQRPTGTFREELLANAAIRVCLRVELISDSNTLLGVPDGAKLDRQTQGRALVRVGGGMPERVQVARCPDSLISKLAAVEAQRLRAAGAAPPRRICQPPLPFVLPRQSAEPTALELTFGLTDLPEQQVQRPALLRAGEQLFVLGTRGCGRTTTVQTLAEAARDSDWSVTAVPADPELAWDAIARLTVDAECGPALVLFDDFDLLEQRFDDEHRAVLLERVQLLLRSGGATSRSCVFTSRRTSGQLLRVQQQCDRTLRLAHPPRNDWILQGGEAKHWQSSLPPGRGRLEGTLVQVAMPREPGLQRADSIDWLPFDIGEGPVAVVARRTGALRASCIDRGITIEPPPTAATLREAAPTAHVLLGDVEQWLGAFGSLGRISEQRPVIVLGATPGEWRSVFRADPLPPALANSDSRGLLRHPDGRLERLLVRNGVPVGVQKTALASS
jgi:S-DNA-T family DNA segregation ATPase FtsK/SpoIIIE